MPELDVLANVSGIRNLWYPMPDSLFGGELCNGAPVIRPQEGGGLVEQLGATGDEATDGLCVEELIFSRSLSVEFSASSVQVNGGLLVFHDWE
jgi:hypothetical protein